MKSGRRTALKDGDEVFNDGVKVRHAHGICYQVSLPSTFEKLQFESAHIYYYESAPVASHNASLGTSPPRIMLLSMALLKRL